MHSARKFCSSKNFGYVGLRLIINVICFTSIHFVRCHGSAEVTERFQCGRHNFCERRGYDTCIGPPLVTSIDDSYCYPCRRLKHTCGKTDQQDGCALYCNEVLQQQNSSTTPVKNTERGNNEDSSTVVTVVAILTSVAATTLVLFFVYMLVRVLRRRAHKRRNPEQFEMNNLNQNAGIVEEDTDETTPLELEGSTQVRSSNMSVEEETSECSATLVNIAQPIQDRQPPRHKVKYALSQSNQDKCYNKIDG